jgi:hypothetical protein
MKKRIVKLVAAIAFVALAFGNGVIVPDSGSREIYLKDLMKVSTVQAESGSGGVRCACKRGDCVARGIFGSRCAPEGHNACWQYSRNCH